MTNLNEISITFTIEEMSDLLTNLEQCESEGYINYGEPSYMAMKKLQDAYFKWKRMNRDWMSEGINE